MAKRPFEFRTTLRTLSRHQVEFIVVGGVSAVLNGAPVSTFDLDVVHARTPGNIARLIGALQELNANYRFTPQRQPDSSVLSSPGHHLLMTSSGPLDVLGMIGDNRTYDDLLQDSFELEIEPGLRIRVLKLDALIAIKRFLGNEKDKAMLPVLERTLEQKSKQDQDSG